MTRLSYTLLHEGQNETFIEDTIIARCATLQSPLNVEVRASFSPTLLSPSTPRCAFFFCLQPSDAIARAVALTLLESNLIPCLQCKGMCKEYLDTMISDHQKGLSNSTICFRLKLCYGYNITPDAIPALNPPQSLLAPSPSQDDDHRRYAPLAADSSRIYMP